MTFKAKWLDADLHLLVEEVWILIQQSSSTSGFILFEMLVVSLYEQAPCSSEKATPSWVLFRGEQVVVWRRVLRIVVVIVFIRVLSSRCLVEL